jgi:hypothetical protein
MKCQGEIFGHSLFVDARARRFSRQELQGLNGVFSLCPGEAGTAALRALIRRVALMIIRVYEFSGFLTRPLRRPVKTAWAMLQATCKCSKGSFHSRYGGVNHAAVQQKNLDKLRVL